MVAVANTGATAVAQPAIAQHFGVASTEVAWLVFGYSAAFAATTACYANAARRFGSGRTLAFGCVVLALGAGSAAFAIHFPVLLISRVVQGLGAGAITTLALAIAGERASGVYRVRGIGVILAGVGVGQAIGPLLGGLLLDTASWRVAVAFGLLALPVVPLVLRWHPGERTGARLDVRGGAILACTIAVIVWIFNAGPAQGLDGSVLIALVLTALSGAALRLHALRQIPERSIVPIRLIRSRPFSRRVTFGALLMAAFTAALTGVPILAAARGSGTGTAIGLIMLPMASVIAVVSAAPRVRRSGRGEERNVFRGLVALGTACFAAAAMASAPAWALAPALVPLGYAYGALAGPLANRIDELVGAECRTTAFGLYNVGFHLGGGAGGALVAGLVRATGSPVQGFAAAMCAIGMCTLVVAFITRHRDIEGPDRIQVEG